MNAGRVGLAAGGHAASLFAVYLVTGPLRVTYLDGAVGARAGAALEAAAFMLASLAAVSAIMPLLSPDWSGREGLAVGVGAVALFLGCDLVVAVSLCGVPAASHLARFGTIPGGIQAAALAFHACAPALWWRGDPDTSRALSPFRSDVPSDRETL